MAPLTFAQIAAAGLLNNYFAFDGVKVSIYNRYLLELADRLARAETKRVARLPENIPLPDEWFDYLNLPSELRYEVLRSTYPHIKLDIHNKDSKVPVPPTALSGNHQIRIDTLYLVLREGCISINGGEAHKRFTEWLDKMDAEDNGRPISPYLFIKHLRFPYFGFFEFSTHSLNADLELAKKCNKLTELEMTISDKVLLQPVHPDDDPLEPVPVDVIIQNFHLDEILELKSLRQLKITYKSTMRGYEWIFGGDQFREMYKMEAHLKHHFAEMGQQVEIEHAIAGYGY